MYFTNWRTFRIWECCWWQPPVIFLPNSRCSLVTTEVLHPPQVASSLPKFPVTFPDGESGHSFSLVFLSPTWIFPFVVHFFFLCFDAKRLQVVLLLGPGVLWWLMVCPWTCFICALHGPLFRVPWVDSEGSTYLEVLPAFLYTLKLLCKWAMLPR